MVTTPACASRSSPPPGVVESIQALVRVRTCDPQRPGSDVRARMWQACDQPHSHRIIDLDKDNRNRRRGCLGCHGYAMADGHEEVRLETNELGGEVRQAIELALCPAGLNGNGLGLAVAEVAQGLQETPGRPASDGRQVGISPGIPWCVSVSMPRPVAPAQSARRAPGPKMRPANAPSDRRPSMRRSRPHDSTRRAPRSKRNMRCGQGSKAHTHRASAAVACASPVTWGLPRPLCSICPPRWPSTWSGWGRGGWARPGHHAPLSLCRSAGAVA
jgi:hypothetical protein